MIFPFSFSGSLNNGPLSTIQQVAGQSVHQAVVVVSSIVALGNYYILLDVQRGHVVQYHNDSI